MDKNEIYLSIKAFADEYYNQKSNYEFIVSQETQQSEIDRLKKGIRHEQFFIIVDLLNFKIIDHGGLEEFGFDSKAFSLKTYFQMIPSKGITSLLKLLGEQTFLKAKSNLMSFLKPSFIVQIPIKFMHEEVCFLTKRTISPWQMTRCGKITAYLAEFTIIKTYDFEPLNPRIKGLSEEYSNIILREFNKNFNQLKPADNPFSPREILILKEYIGGAKSSKDLAESLGLKINTVNSYNKSILEKAKQFFGENLPLNTAFDVAKFMSKQGLLK
ncbi:helix-turn-helix transcriptional regulator [Flectobacillus longus]|uniref:helix-turn-helix transcriptional regulator n=1 Tax=Flectobacillus longus TaxID=2984207 RepID=UPI0024B6B5F1|nr:LuxR C-terminal-related transcriptional regulator [Flectobacillus longus]MDI9878292.1 LuxR C-terminal-related transcriptional regulator [Flectobacillus longus]